MKWTQREKGRESLSLKREPKSLTQYWGRGVVERRGSRARDRKKREAERTYRVSEGEGAMGRERREGGAHRARVRPT